MEAETYLKGGYGLRLAMGERTGQCVPLREVADVSMPNRTKGTLVGPDSGVAWLAATQVFDVRPTPRKWLSLSRIGHSNDLFVSPGTILVTRSGSVGRSTLATDLLAGVLCSDDLLRVRPRDETQWGWLYAYLRSPQARAMMSSAQYGHIIKHLEVSHLDALPVPKVSADVRRHFLRRARAILDLRNRAHTTGIEAELAFAEAVGPLGPSEPEEGFSVKARALLVGRRRLEASFHAPGPSAVLRRFKEIKAPVMPLSQLVQRTWWMSRFRRFYGEAGIPYLSADELFTTNPIESKRILVQPGDGHEDFFVKRGWIVMACSGQIYGLNGAACLATEHHENVFFSHDLIRIIPKSADVRSGYLLTALTHPTLGRPLLIRAAYGTSIPHLDPDDVAAFPVVRLSAKLEERIADLAESSAAARAGADALERELAAEAEAVIDAFLAGANGIDRLLHVVT